MFGFLASLLNNLKPDLQYCPKYLERNIEDDPRTHYYGKTTIINKINKILRASNLDVSSISLKEAIEYYKKAGELEWKRLFTTQAYS